MRKPPSRPSPIAVTMGEPAGVGGEIALRAYQTLAKESGPVFFLIDDPERIRREARQFDIDLSVIDISSPTETHGAFAAGMPVLPLSEGIAARAGHPAKTTAPMVIESIDMAVRLCQDSSAAAMVTNPIQKSVLYETGFKFPGHTEYVAAKTGCARPVMMLASPDLRVAPATIHLPLATAIGRVTVDLITHTVQTVDSCLRSDFAVQTPRIAVSGLNPHAGENGALGSEEETIIEPAVRSLRDSGIDAFGPVPADALFTARRRKEFDVAVCMYHDQALIPIKALDVDRAVNVTLGLPIVRTSPDHGTALDIAGRGVANPSSLVAAIKIAQEMATNRNAASAGR